MGVVVTTWVHVDESKISAVHTANYIIITCAKPSWSRNVGAQSSLYMTDDKLIQKPDEDCIVPT